MSESVTIDDIYNLFRASQVEFDRRLAVQEQKEAEAKAERDRTMAELKQTVERTSRAVDSLTSRWGRFVEELVEPSVLELFQAKGINVKEIYPRARVKRQVIAMEIDILAVDETELVLVECKSRFSKDDVDEFLDVFEPSQKVPALSSDECCNKGFPCHI